MINRGVVVASAHNGLERWTVGPETVGRVGCECADPASTPPSAGQSVGPVGEPGNESGRALTGLERGRGAGRRLSESQRAAEEGELTREQFLFVVAMDEFKRVNGVGYPSWSDIIEVIRLLGYRKTCKSELRLTRAEDWRESGDAAANVRPFGWERRFAKAAGGLSLNAGGSEQPGKPGPTRKAA